MAESEPVLVLIPAWNEAQTLGTVLDGVTGLAVLVVDDGSDDDTAVRVSDRAELLSHPKRLGYGRSLLDGFAWARDRGYRSVITMDADGQHDPACLGVLREGLRRSPLVLGSRYLPGSRVQGHTPPERKALNREMTGTVNRLAGLELSDVFSGFLGLDLATIASLALDEPGWCLCLQLWMRAGLAGMSPLEVPVARIYAAAPRSAAPLRRRRRDYLACIQREASRAWARKDPHARRAGGGPSPG